MTLALVAAFLVGGGWAATADELVEKNDGAAPTADLPSPKPGEPEAADDGEPRKTLGEYLYAVGKKLDCHFTVEDCPPEGQAAPWLLSIEEFTWDADLETVDQLVTRLATDLPKVKVWRSERWPSVVHLVAKDLLKEGFVMDQVVEIGAYRGLLYDLPDHIGSLTDARVRTQRGFSTATIFSVDQTTRVDIKDERGTVRDILTKHAIKDGKAVIIWGAFRMTPQTPYLYVYIAEHVQLDEIKP